MSGESDLPDMDADPIDAEYEPVPPSADFVETQKAASKGPGWTALGVTGILAALFGTGAGAVLSGGGASNHAPKTLVEDVQLIAEGQQTQENQTAKLIEELDTRLRREISSIAAGRGDDEAIADLTAQMNAISNQLEAFDVARQEAAQGEGVDLDRVLARVEALETLEEGEVASPRLANRAIQSAQRRIDELETDLTTRNDAMLNLVSRLEAAEGALAKGVVNGISKGDGEGAPAIDPEVIEVLTTDIEELRTGIEALKASVNEQATAAQSPVQAEEIEELRTLLQELRESGVANTQALSARGAGQTATFSMLSIEAAARDGQPFQAAFARLEEALPGNRSVAKLKPLAATGAPTIASLQGSFTKARAEAAKISGASEDGTKDGWSWVRQALGEAVVVRRSDDETGEDAEQAGEGSAFGAVMEVAELRLAVRDVEGAIGAVNTLAESVRAPFDGWLTDARARQELEDGLDELRLTLMNTGR